LFFLFFMSRNSKRIKYSVDSGSPPSPSFVSSCAMSFPFPSSDNYIIEPINPTSFKITSRSSSPCFVPFNVPSVVNGTFAISVRVDRRSIFGWAKSGTNPYESGSLSSSSYYLSLEDYCMTARGTTSRINRITVSDPNAVESYYNYSKGKIYFFVNSTEAGSVSVKKDDASSLVPFILLSARSQCQVCFSRDDFLCRLPKDVSFFPVVPSDEMATIFDSLRKGDTAFLDFDRFIAAVGIQDDDQAQIAFLVSITGQSPATWDIHQEVFLREFSKAGASDVRSMKRVIENWKQTYFGRDVNIKLKTKAMSRCFPLFSCGNPPKVPFENVRGLLDIFGINARSWPLFEQWLKFIPSVETVAVDPKDQTDIIGIPRSVWQRLIQFVGRFPKKIDRWTEDDADNFLDEAFSGFAREMLKEDSK